MRAIPDFHSGDPPPSAEQLAQLADALAWPLLLLRRDASLLHANLAARSLLQRGAPLQLDRQGRLQAAAARRAEFAAALRDAGSAQTLLQWRGAVGSCTATLVALPGSDALADNALLLLAFSPDSGRASDTAAFATLHGLRDAETRALQRLVLGDNSSRAATALGVSPATVRSQTASLRRKTGHASVPALLRALAALPPLLPLSLLVPPAPPAPACAPKP